MVLSRVLRSPVIWKLSGICYPTAVIATHGWYARPVEYLDECQRQVALVLPHLGKSRSALEFGCGIGGNLIALSRHVPQCTGLDVNRGYLRIARRLARRFGASNAAWQLYDGHSVPESLGHPDAIFSIGVFERIPKADARLLLQDLSRLLSPNGRMALYFLTDRAKGTAFTRRLGDSAYEFWSHEELTSVVRDLGLTVRSWTNWPANPFGSKRSFAESGDRSYADLLVMQK